MNATTHAARPARTLKVLTRADGWFMVAITDRGTEDTYLVRPSPSSVGTAARWEKMGANEAHTAELGGEQAGPSCSCPHGTFRGQTHRECRHVAASRVLVARGLLSCG